MTIQRFTELYKVVDDLNSHNEYCGTLSHCSYEDEIHITMFNTGSHLCFYTSQGVNYLNGIHNDKNLEKAEAFMRMLIRQAEVKEGKDVHPGQL